MHGQTIRGAIGIGYIRAVSFFRRLLSPDYRRAAAAEAAGNLDVAAEHYGLAGDAEAAVRMHLLRARRAGSRALEIAALRDAVHAAGQQESLRKRPAAELGEVLLSALEAEGIATARDRERVREAAALLVAGGEHQRAGDALVLIGEYLAAADAYSAGGLVEAMEAALAKDDDGQERARAEQSSFANYQTSLAVGRRDEAREELARAFAASGNAEYRRLLEALEGKLLTGGRVELSARGRPPLVVCAVRRLVLGRDALCDLVLRSGGVSRQHAEIVLQDAPVRYALHDLKSRNGTSVGGLPLAGALALESSGTFSLGEECTVEHSLVAAAAPSAGRALPAGSEAEAGPASLPVLRLRVSAGLDRGTQLLAAPEHVAIDLSSAELGVAITFRDGRPFLAVTSAREVRFCGEPLGAVAVQLIRGDQLRIDGIDVDVG